MTGPADTAPLPVPVPPARWAALAARWTGDPMLRSSVFIMATSVVTSAFGYVYWLIVAHRQSAAEVGAGAAATSALQATAIFAAVGAAAAMVEWLPRSDSPDQWRGRFTAGVLAAAGSAGAGSLLVVGLLGHLTGTLPILGTPEGAALFVVGTVCFAVGTVLDYAAVSARRGGTMLVRNLGFVVPRIPLVLLPWVAGEQILGSWAVAGALSLVAGVLAFRDGPHGPPRPVWRGLGGHLRLMAGSLAGQHLITIAAMLPAYLLPLLVVARVSDSANAYFYATWMLGAVFFMISPAVSTSLFAAGAEDPASIRAHARRGAVIIGGLLVVPVVVCLVGGGLLLRLFGPDYPAQGHLLLVLLTLSAVPDAVTNLAVALLRATRRLRTALALNATMLVLTLAASWLLLPRLGIAGVGWSWLGAQTLGALWVFARWRRITTPQTGTPRLSTRQISTRQISTGEPA